MEKVLGFWEHLPIVWFVLKEARAKKSLAASIWLDIANGYWLIPHKLRFFPLQRYWIPNQGIKIDHIVQEVLASLFQKQLPLVGIDISVEYLQVAQFLQFCSL